MKDRPILFSAPMVRALLDGSKTQTRRIVKPVGNDGGFVLLDYGAGIWPYRSDDGEISMHTIEKNGKLYTMETPHSCPYGQSGDRIWVRETWRHTAFNLEEARSITEDIMSGTAVDWRADYVDRMMRNAGFTREDAEMACDFETWRPSIHMPRWASRIDLEITGIRVERLQDISEDDAKAEGINCYQFRPDDGFPLCDGFMVGQDDGKSTLYSTAKGAYRNLWESINGAGSWDANPWVWCISFKVIQK